MDLFSLTKERLTGFLEEHLEKPFRAKQIFEWIYQKKINSFDEMSNLPQKLRVLLQKEIRFSSLKFKKSFFSKDGQTCKYLWELDEGSFIESVLILSGNRRTVCVSSQVGCRGGCLFCASGKEGFIRNLTVSEIVEQVVNIERFLNEKKERISNVVFMGMGEPLDNFEAVLSAIKIINEELNISQRKITISTVGLIEQISKLIDAKESFLKVNLTLSLHAPNQRIREAILPWAKKNNFFELIAIMHEYYVKTKRDVTFEYILIDKVNDRTAHAEELVAALSSFKDKSHFNINLIPYNPVSGINFFRPKKESVDAFFGVLEREGIKVSQRYAKGSDISAACGQLAFLHSSSKNRFGAKCAPIFMR